jgi:hypothetical protein
MNRTPALVLTAALAVAPLAQAAAHAQANPRGEAKLTLAGKAIAIEYGRPSLKGRDMLARAEVGEAWRMGADAATRLKTEAELSFGSVVVPKGEYVLTATKLAEDEWRLNVTGPDKSAVAEVLLAAASLDESVETFTIELTGSKDQGTFLMTWGKQAFSAPFKAK